MRMKRRKPGHVIITLTFLLVFVIHESNVKSDYIDNPDITDPGPEIIPVEIDRSQIIGLDDVLLWDQSQQQSWETPSLTQFATIGDEPSADLMQWKGDRCDQEDPSQCLSLTRARDGYGIGPYGGGPYGGGPYGGGHYGGGHHGGGPYDGHGLGLGLGLQTTLGISGWGPFISKKATFQKFGLGWDGGLRPLSYHKHFQTLRRPTGNIYYPGNKYYSGSHANVKLKRKKKKKSKKGKKKKKAEPKKYKRRKHHLKPLVVHHIGDDDDDDDSGWERTLRNYSPNSRRPFLRKELKTKLGLH